MTTTSSACQLLGSTLILANAFALDPNRHYVVKNLLLGSQVSMLCGPPNTGKSAVLACIASHVAMGRDFGGHKVRRALVVYVAAEDPNGIGERAFPFMQGAPAATAPFFILARPVDLTNQRQTGRLIDELAGLKLAVGCDDVLLIVDTLNLCIGEGDENSARDMGRAVGNAQAIAAHAGAHVMIVHHTSNHDSGRPRGSTALEGNLDTVLVLRRADSSQPDGVVFITQEKQRSVPKGKPVPFQIMGFDAGLDSEGDPLTVPYAVPFAPKSSLVPAPSARQKSQKAPAGNERAEDAQRVLAALDGTQPGQWHDPKSVSDASGVPFNSVRDNPDSLRKAIKRALDDLVESGGAERSPQGGYRLRSASFAAQQPPAQLQ